MDFTSIRLYETKFMSSFQNEFAKFENLFIFSCHLGDPLFTYLFAASLILFNLEYVTFKLFIAVTLSEWTNVMIKWIISDDRPYWWVGEHKSASSIHLKQFSITCETGPGNPSGHVMVTTVVMYTIFYELVAEKKIRSSFMKAIVIISFALGLCSIALGRIYISAHFPDQCIGGLLFGLATGYLINSVMIKRKRLSVKYILALVTIIVASTYSHDYIYLINGKEENWSLNLAKKHCFDPTYAHADTTPLVVFWRASSAIIGVSIATRLYSSLCYILKLKERCNERILKFIRKQKTLIKCLIAYGLIMFNKSFLKLTKYQTTDLSDLNIFYSVAFVQFLCLPLVNYFLVVFIKRNLFDL